MYSFSSEKGLTRDVMLLSTRGNLSGTFANLVNFGLVSVKAKVVYTASDVHLTYPFFVLLSHHQYIVYPIIPLSYHNIYSPLSVSLSLSLSPLLSSFFVLIICRFTEPVHDLTTWIILTAILLPVVMGSVVFGGCKLWRKRGYKEIPLSKQSVINK